MLQQSITTYELLKVIGLIITIAGGAYAISMQIKSERDKYATKEYVEKELDIIDERMKSFDKEQISINDDLKYIRCRLDQLIDNISKNGSK